MTARRVMLVLSCALLATPAVDREAGALVLCKRRGPRLLVREACKRRETQLDLADLGGSGPQGPPGPPGQEGPQGPAGVVPSSFARKSAVSGPLLATGYTTVLALSDPGGGDPIVLPTDGVLLATASVTITENPNSAAGTVSCVIQAQRTSPDPEPGFTQLNTPLLHSFAATGPGEANHATIGLASAASKTAGTYDVRVRCLQQPAMILEFRQGDLVVSAAPS